MSKLHFFFRGPWGFVALCWRTYTDKRDKGDKGGFGGQTDGYSRFPSGITTREATAKRRTTATTEILAAPE
jgi:hypothetical protein